MAKLVTLISEQGASVMDITHERAWLHTSVDQVVNKVVVGELRVFEREREMREGGRVCKVEVVDSEYCVREEEGGRQGGTEKRERVRE